MNLAESDLTDLKRARDLLETPGLTAKITSALGTPIEKGFGLMPDKWREAVHKASEAALMKALAVAVRSLGDEPEVSSSNGIHKIAAASSGAVGGAFGLLALAVELPISTTIMLRSIADIARSEGENPQAIDTKLACLTVFALGGKSTSDDAAESGYFAVRAGLATAVTEAARYLAEKGLGAGATPALVRLVSTLAARFGVVVSEKAAAQAVPILGAAGGAVINTLFIDHFQDMARGHFIVRRLEKVYGMEVVQRAYESV
jgi:hypothetical protein